MTMADTGSEEGMATTGYHVGDFDRRPWGFWLAMDVNPGYCEKIIVVMPGQILSLQSHRLRHETWTVLDGTMLAIVDDKCVSLISGEKIDITPGQPHAMANPGNAPCILKERQTGVCSEGDIIRYLDAYGRITNASSEQVLKSANLYLAVLDQIKKKDKKYA